MTRLLLKLDWEFGPEYTAHTFIYIPLLNDLDLCKVITTVVRSIYKVYSRIPFS